jgi:type IV pilus assembly protein PilN
MIRINLLPEAKRQVAAAGGIQLWGVIYLLSTFAWCVVLFLVYLQYKNELDEQEAKNRELEGQIERAKAQSANIGEVEEKLAKSKRLEEVVNKLQAARSGPARVLMEVSKILSEGRGPTADIDALKELERTNPLMMPNDTWDIRRLWIESFTETNRRCNIAGLGKTNEDVAEFLRRLNVSETFDQVTLQSTSAIPDPKTQLPVVRFTLSCEVKY